MKRLVRGFTLIELLIVVAIIAILAAIAVPNLLEAQTRSKVSRVKADMRSYATALEAYSVDHNDYPPILGNFVTFDDWVDLEYTLVPLSTPVSYLSDALFVEPFNSRQGMIMYRGWNVIDFGERPPDRATRQPIYGYVAFPNDAMTYPMSFAVSLLLNNSSISLTAEEVREVFAKRWIVFSPGPDTFYRFDQLLATSANPDIITSIFDQVAVATLPERNGIYDPTNGTTSIGEIARTRAGSTDIK